ncbi:MAG: hypothetical protein JKY67_09135, partial [Pseudomonadales bacterium]|nr:hypothetical protein [Pseudomonadales bacterium]
MYWWGLDSGFILDDSANLYLLRDITLGEMSVWEFVTSGQAGPGGRPLSLLSFAIQHASWPDQPKAFKLVNLSIHLVNTVVLYFIAKLIGSYLGLQTKRRVAVACMATLWWAIHPLHVSSVLYAIQRMNLLSHFFMMATILVYLQIRSWVVGRENFFSFMLLGSTVSTGMVLSVLSKENGVLIPAYLLVIEFSFFTEGQNKVFWRSVRGFVLVMPLLAIIGYLIWTRQSLVDAYVSRNFTLYERLLTESRVLWMYVQSIFFPVTGQYGVVHDNIVVSRSLLSPFTTLISLV